MFIVVSFCSNGNGNAHELTLQSPLSSTGGVPGGLKVHPGSQHLIYSVGCKVIIEDLSTKKQDFLSGHTREVSCLAVSRSGKYVASGQITHMGFKVIIKMPLKYAIK